jgi:transposase
VSTPVNVVFPLALPDVNRGSSQGRVEVELLVERVAGLDVAKAEVVAAVRVPDGAGGRRQEIRTYAAFSASLEAMAAWLTAEGVTQVVMESTGQYWKPVWYVLAEADFELKLVNARHVKMVPGHKTDVADAAWLAQLAEVGLLRGSFVPPPAIARLRDLTRYRRRLIQARTAEHQRIEKTLEDAGIKLDVVASQLTGVSATAMVRALVAGERDPEVLAQLAQGRLRAKLPALRAALRGHFGDHHALIIGIALDHVDNLEVAIARLDTQVEAEMAPFAEAARHLDTITGVGPRSAQEIIAEIGADMSMFPTASHLASWAAICPGNNRSAGKRHSGRTAKGNIWLKATLTECAWSAAHAKDAYLSAQFWRLARRRGSKRAAIAVGHSILVIAWHLLSHHCDYADLGGDYFATRDAQRSKHRAIQQLQALGYHVTLEPAA